MKRVFICVVAFVVLFVAEGYAQEKYKELLKKFVPVDSISDIRAIGANLVEVVIDIQGRKNIVYITSDDEYLIFGAIMDKNGKRITQERYDELNKIDFSKIPIENAIVIKKGNGDKKLVMLTDVECPFCVKAYKWLQTQTDYTLYVFLYPIDSLHPTARVKSTQILCSKDKISALNDVKEGIPLKTTTACKDGNEMLAKHVLTGEILGVTGTPLFVLGNGRKIEGFNPLAIESYLKGGK